MAGEALSEAGGDHFYGAWTGGSSGSGGHSGISNSEAHGLGKMISSVAGARAAGRSYGLKMKAATTVEKAREIDNEMTHFSRGISNEDHARHFAFGFADAVSS